MTTDLQIEAVCTRALRALPASIAGRLRILPVDSPGRSTPKIRRGRILGRSAGQVWDPQWCFFEVGIGLYSNANEPTWGGVGLVCYVDQKGTGSGTHRPALERLVSSYPRGSEFGARSKRGDANQGVFVYYTKREHRSFPENRAVRSLTDLILNTASVLDALRH